MKKNQRKRKNTMMLIRYQITGDKTFYVYAYSKEQAVETFLQSGIWTNGQEYDCKPDENQGPLPFSCIDKQYDFSHLKKKVS